jgi:hypothetical protein
VRVAPGAVPECRTAWGQAALAAVRARHLAHLAARSAPAAASAEGDTERWDSRRTAAGGMDWPWRISVKLYASLSSSRACVRSLDSKTRSYAGKREGRRAVQR